MKIKVRQSEPVVNDIEVELPFYSYVQEDLSDVFVKIDENGMYRIDFNSIAVEVFCDKKISVLPKLWFDNPCTKEEYDNAVERLKKYISNF